MMKMEVGVGGRPVDCWLIMIMIVVVVVIGGIGETRRGRMVFGH